MVNQNLTLPNFQGLDLRNFFLENKKNAPRRVTFAAQNLCYFEHDFQ
jgi:hypothetical protein